MRFITLSELRARLGGRSRNSIFRDIELGLLPEPIKLGRQSTAARNYWDEGAVNDAMRRLMTNSTVSDDDAKGEV